MMAGKKTTHSRKYNNKKINSTASDSSLFGGIKLIAIVLVSLLVFYFLTVYILNKKEPYEIINNASIQYTEILAGEVFDQDSHDYYVLFFDKEADNAEDYNTLVSDYKSKESHKDIYTVDLSEGLNKKYVSTEEDNKDVTDVSNLKVKGATLIYIVDGKVEQYVVENIKEFLNNN